MTRRISFYVPVRAAILGLFEALMATFTLAVAMVATLGPLNARAEFGDVVSNVRMALVSGLFVLCMYYFDLYNPTVLRNTLGVVIKITKCFIVMFVLLAVIYLLFPTLRLQQDVVMWGTGTAAALAIGWRQMFHYATHWPAFQERILILGDGQLGHELTSLVGERPEMGYRVVSRPSLVTDSPLDNHDEESELQQIVEFHHVRRVVVTMGERRGRLPVNSLLALKEHGIIVQDGSDFYETLTGKVYLDSLRPSSLLFSQAFEVSAFSMFTQRLLSFLVSAAMLVLLAPLMLVLAVAIKLESRGPVIFRQKRVGLHGKLFTLYKFRSMHEGSDGVRPAEEGDDRLTGVGRWLRAARLDELPQFWNILRGDMHLVGPRPFVPEQEQYLREKLPFYKLRWSVPPGATGWAQVSRGYCSTLEDNADKLACDLFYIKHFSLGLDLLVLFKTAKIVLLGRGGR